MLFVGQYALERKLKIIVDRNMLGGAFRLVPWCQNMGVEALFFGMASGADDILRQKRVFLPFGFGSRSSPAVPALTSFNPDLLRNAGQPFPLRTPAHPECISIHKAAGCWTAASSHDPGRLASCLFRVLSAPLSLASLGCRRMLLRYWTAWWR